MSMRWASGGACREPGLVARELEQHGSLFPARNQCHLWRQSVRAVILPTKGCALHGWFECCEVHQSGDVAKKTLTALWEPPVREFRAEGMEGHAYAGDDRLGKFSRKRV